MTVLNSTNVTPVVLRADWSREDLRQMFDAPLLELVQRASIVHKQHHDLYQIQRCTLLSVKTGGCSEDCSYCPQSARYQTNVENSALLEIDQVVDVAKEAKESGSTRFCMGAAWREVEDGADFDRILGMVAAVKQLGMEACCTLGMLSKSQAKRLKQAGLTAYNHNLDTSPEFYGDVISTRVYEDRLRTIDNVREAGITVCCGGIIGMGESVNDRIGLILQLCNMNPHPESVPINMLVPVAGTPMENQKFSDVFDLVRMVAVARITMPKARVRLSAGRINISPEGQALCFLAGANSIFSGDKLLTTPNNSSSDDDKLISTLGMSFAV